MRSSSVWILVVLIALLLSCKENQVFTEHSGAKLTFSTDTVQFDTVFSTIGSTTLNFRLYNPNDNAVRTTIRLGGGGSSNYRLNIDGIKTDGIADYEIRGNDSVYVFVEVTVDPQSSNSPMVVEDSVMFYTNGNEQKVRLVAFGQDVHLFNGEILETQTWEADKPYLIYNSVAIDSFQTLTIKPGAQLHFHYLSSLIVYGTLDARGTMEEMIVFQGDRLEDVYDDIPGQWGAVGYDSSGNEGLLAGIQFMQSSVNNIIDYTVVKNAFHGIGLYPPPVSSSAHILQLSNSIITNMSYFGVYSYASRLLMYNSVIANCGSHALLVTLGGLCEVYHSTISNFLPGGYAQREAAAVGLSNYLVNGNEVEVNALKVLMANTIIDGSLAEELIVDRYWEDGVQFEYELDHCMLKVDTTDISDVSIFKNVMKIQSPDSTPRYMNKELGDYRLDTLSAAKDRGLINYGRAFPFDFDGISRTADGMPDIGAFERVETLTEGKE